MLCGAVVMEVLMVHVWHAAKSVPKYSRGVSSKQQQS